jgi:pimeloyl-ACP methyl ester carboxylesterase
VVVDDGSRRGHGLAATVVAMPYDFRRSIVEAAVRLDGQVRCRLARLWPDDGDRPRVVIVAHSMGRLVARYWLAQQENWKLCRALITLGTPHRGAPKALDVLADGVKLPGGLRVTRPVPVLREWAAWAWFGMSTQATATTASPPLESRTSKKAR